MEGVASVTVDGGLRRQIRIELSREKITALDLPVDRIIRHCLEKKAEARFRSAHDLAFALDALLVLVQRMLTPWTRGAQA